MRAAVALSLALALLASHAPAAQSPFAVTVRGGPAQPGSVLEITLTGASAFSDPRGTAFGQPLVFMPGDTPHVWRSLVGVDVAQPAGNTLKAANLIRRFVMKAVVLCR